MSLTFNTLQKKGFELSFTYHADSILHQDFREAAQELEVIFSEVTIPVEELVRSGGGEAQVTQRLRRALRDKAWPKAIFRVEKKINDVTTQSQTHEVDHVKRFENGTIALEIEWNNKDPFFDRDLENFNRLHADGAISIGIIVTRGTSLQAGIEGRIRQFAQDRKIGTFQQLAAFNLEPTRRQRAEIERTIERNGWSFDQAWAKFFVSDKFGAATTHWAKLESRLERGVGSPCPIVGIGIPLACLTS